MIVISGTPTGMRRILPALLRRLALPTAIAMSAISAVGLLYWFIVNDDIAMDFSVYWRAASEPLSEVYLPRPTLNFPYAPTMLLWIAPLALLPLGMSYAIWVGISIFAFVGACRMHLKYREICLALGSFPMVYCLLNGQVATTLTALLIWACTTRNRVAAGVAFAVIFSIKPQFVLMAPLLLLVRRDLGALVSFAISSVAIIAASVAAFGVETWESWLRALDHFHQIVIKNGVLQVTITPASAAELWGLPSLPFLIGGAAIGALVVIKCRQQPSLQQATAVAVGSLLASPYAIMYDFVAVMPFLAWSIFRGNLFAALISTGTLSPLPLLATGYFLAHGRNGNEVRECGQLDDLRRSAAAPN